MSTRPFTNNLENVARSSGPLRGVALYFAVLSLYFLDDSFTLFQVLIAFALPTTNRYVGASFLAMCLVEFVVNTLSFKRPTCLSLDDKIGCLNMHVSS